MTLNEASKYLESKTCYRLVDNQFGDAEIDWLDENNKLVGYGYKGRRSYVYVLLSKQKFVECDALILMDCYSKLVLNIND